MAGSVKRQHRNEIIMIILPGQVLTFMPVAVFLSFRVLRSETVWVIRSGGVGIFWPLLRERHTTETRLDHEYKPATAGARTSHPTTNPARAPEALSF